MFYSFIILLTVVTPLREVTAYAPILNDVYSQLSAGHDYTCDDDITTVHEATHGINARLRGLYGKPSFYILNNQAITLDEPDGTLTMVAEQIPKNLRGNNYKLYLVDARRYWDGQPTYVFDEFVAYTNGAQARLDLGREDRIGVVKRMAEFLTYSICVPWAIESNDPRIRAFLRYQIDRALSLGAGEYIDINDPGLQGFMIEYFGLWWFESRFGDNKVIGGRYNGRQRVRNFFKRGRK